MKSIVFNTEMVRAILDGRKTTTRRVVLQNKDIQEFKTTRYPNGWWLKGRVYVNWNSLICDLRREKSCKYWTGDTLYVREMWQYMGCVSDDSRIAGQIVYRADWKGNEPLAWRPSIHMPKEAARLFLRVTNVRVERLQDIDANGCIAEGIPYEEVVPAISSLPDNPFFDMDKIVGDMQQREEEKLIAQSFGNLWNNNIKPKDINSYGWDANPWVQVISFERISKEEALK